MRHRNRRWGLGAAVAASWALGGCGLLLGLDEYGPQTCTDGIKGEGETDVDCGGICAKVCGDGMGCGAPKDCESGVCGSLGLCEAASCTDGLKNGDESDKDCGGSCGATCKAGGLCEAGGDCVGSVCEGGACAATCTDKEKSGSETDVDCGGPDCDGCEIGQGCGVAGDCASGICHAEGCVAEHVWSMRFGDGAEQTALSMAIDKAGNVIVAGAMKGTVDFGGGPITSPPNGAYFLTKMDAGGKHLWTKLFGESTGTSLSVAVDSNANVFIACTSSTAVNFGGGLLTPAGGPDIFIAKLNSSGEHAWSYVFGDVGLDNVRDIEVTAKDSVVIAGDFYGPISFGGDILPKNDNFGDIFVAEFTNNGQHAWSKSYLNSSSVFSMLMDVNSSGEIIIGGSFQGMAMDFGGGPLVPVAKLDVYLAKLDATGNHLWSKRFGDNESQTLNDLAVGEADEILLVGQFDASFDFGGGYLSHQGAMDAFVAQLDTEGEHSWSRPFGDPMNQSARDVALDSSGKIIVSGVMSGMIDFGGGLLTANDDDVFLLTLTSSGDHVWSRRLGESNTQTPSDIATDGLGNLAVIGDFQGSIHFGSNQLTTAGSTDVFVAKLAYP